MSRMIKNMVAFTLVLGLGTLAVEYFRKGTIQMEDAASFLLTILFMGVVGGYIYTWTYDKSR
jgi:hypothetical protein